MKSHEYGYAPADLARLIAGPLFTAAAFILAMHAGARLHVLPAPRPTLDTDRTILIHQAEAARRAHDAHILLIGDSSCLMDVNARQLGKQLGLPALNLGTLSFLDLAQYAALLRRYAEANPNRLRVVVLLMNPEALRRVGAEEYYVNVLDHFWAGQDFCRAGTFDDHLACWLGLEVFRGRILSRAVPIPLAGAFGRRYGFNRDLEVSMNLEDGSVIDPALEQPRGRAEYRLSPTLKRVSQEFRAAVPAGARLIVGITPTPATASGPAYAAGHAAMLQEWAGWLQADGVLTNLPPILPDASFSRPTHLNEGAVPDFTTNLGESLQTFLNQ